MGQKVHMCKEIKLLDCTLRDGGYVNNWEFGNSVLTHIFDRLNSANVDIIEIGFLDDRYTFDPNRSIQSSVSDLKKAYEKCVSKKSKVFAMIDYGTFDIDHLEKYDGTFIDGIRLIFKKENMHKAAEYGRSIKSKGYEFTLQMVSVTSYNDDDVKEFSKIVNDVKPLAVGIVDTYGLMHREQVFHYFELLDKYLNEDIAIGYHSHNNFQLAYSNSIEILKNTSNRNIIVDGSLYGMGKSAGNAPTELISMHLNEYYAKNYDLNHIMEAIDVSVMPIYSKQYWGYNLHFYVAAKNDCHPNYVKYLLEKKVLSIKNVNEILDEIDYDKKLKFDESYIEKLYVDYLLNLGDIGECTEMLSKKLNGKEILLIAPGKSITVNEEKIKSCIEKIHPVVIGVNYVPSAFDLDYVFFSNSKRYVQMLPELNNKDVKIIASSNITPVRGHFDYTIRYDTLTRASSTAWNIALVHLMCIILRLDIKCIYLAGFDGYTGTGENFVNKEMEMELGNRTTSLLNQTLADKIKEYRKTQHIIFLTESIYEGEKID